MVWALKSSLDTQLDGELIVGWRAQQLDGGLIVGLRGNGWIKG